MMDAHPQASESQRQYLRVEGSIGWCPNTASHHRLELPPLSRVDNHVPRVKCHSSIAVDTHTNPAALRQRSSALRHGVDPYHGTLRVSLALSGSTYDHIPFVWLVVSIGSSQESTGTANKSTVASKTFLIPTSAITAMGRAIRQVADTHEKASRVSDGADCTRPINLSPHVSVVAQSLDISSLLNRAVPLIASREAALLPNAVSLRMSLHLFVPTLDVVDGMIDEVDVAAARRAEHAVQSALLSLGTHWCRTGDTDEKSLRLIEAMDHHGQFDNSQALPTASDLFVAASASARRVLRTGASGDASTNKRAREADDLPGGNHPPDVPLPPTSHISEWDLAGVAHLSLVVEYSNVIATISKP